MSPFENPFQGIIERKMTTEQLIREIRCDIEGELKAIFNNDARAQATDDLIVKEVIRNICSEDRAHICDLMSLLRDLDPNETYFLASVEAEAKEMLGRFDYRALTVLWKAWTEVNDHKQDVRCL